MTVRGKIVRIGNSRGVRLPKPLLEQSGITGDVELETGDGMIVIHASNHIRENWESAFSEMAVRGDDALMDESGSVPSWDESEWVWE